ncbi:MAG: hypothetical protein HC800_25450 [Phormidesmis sp. RL_2_1]|nr:hypothetical protein [Phormidesmis sp. RL_2_1]
MSNQSVSSLLLAVSLFSGLVLTGVENRAALAEPLRTSRSTQSQVRPDLNPDGSTDLITPSEPEDVPQVRPGLNPDGSPQLRTPSGSGTVPVAWPAGPPCELDILPPGHWGAPCVFRAVDDDPFN